MHHHHVCRNRRDGDPLWCGWEYERWRGVDKADFDLIYQWSIERFGSNDDQAQAMQRACQKQTWEILIQHWGAVDALAAMLYARGKATGRETHHIIQQTIDASVIDWCMGAWNNISPFQVLESEDLGIEYPRQAFRWQTGWRGRTEVMENAR